jgi:hypothetical protein
VRVRAFVIVLPERDFVPAELNVCRFVSHDLAAASRHSFLSLWLDRYSHCFVSGQPALISKPNRGSSVHFPVTIVPTMAFVRAFVLSALMELKR